MIAECVHEVISKDLKLVRKELNAFQSDNDIWVCPSGLPNSTGTLILHITGNLRYFIGATLGGIAYERDRAGEFSEPRVSRVELESKLALAAEAVDTSLACVDEARLPEEYPIEVDGIRWPTAVFLTRLVSHLAYHVGQINYHRRMVESVGQEKAS